MNVFCATGNLGRDCSTNNVNGNAVCNFALAVKSGYGDNQQTVWLDCALWGKRAESGLVQHLTKGKQVAVSGELGTREYQAKDGTQRMALTLRVADVTLMGDGGSGGQSQGGQSAPQQPAAPSTAPAAQNPHDPRPTNPGSFDDFDDEIPF